MAVKYRVIPVVAVWFGSGNGVAKEMAGGGRYGTPRTIDLPTKENE